MTMFPHIFEDVLPLELFMGVHDAINPTDNAWTLTNHSQKGNSHLNDSVSWLLPDHKEKLQFYNAGSHIKYKLSKHYYKHTGIKANFEISRIFSNGQTTSQSTVFHTDYSDPGFFTVVLFTEKSWDITFGGEFVCKDPQGKYHYTPYIPNTAVVIPSSWEHRGTPPFRMTDRLRTSLAISYHDPNCIHTYPTL